MRGGADVARMGQRKAAAARRVTVSPERWPGGGQQLRRPAVSAHGARFTRSVIIPRGAHRAPLIIQQRVTLAAATGARTGAVTSSS